MYKFELDAATGSAGLQAFCYAAGYYAGVDATMPFVAAESTMELQEKLAHEFADYFSAMVRSYYAGGDLPPAISVAFDHWVIN